MIKEKYMPLLLSCQFGGITIIDDTHNLGTIVIKDKESLIQFE